MTKGGIGESLLSGWLHGAGRCGSGLDECRGGPFRSAGGGGSVADGADSPRQLSCRPGGMCRRNQVMGETSRVK